MGIGNTTASSAITCALTRASATVATGRGTGVSPLAHANKIRVVDTALAKQTDMAGRFCGHSNPPVNLRGYRQIDNLLKALGDESIDAIYTSDLVRAGVTADALASVSQISPIVMPSLREINFGDWEGLGWQEVESRDADYAHRWSDGYPELAAPGAELFATFEAEVLTAVESIVEIPDVGCVAVVTHGGVMRVVLGELCGLNEKEAWGHTNTYCGFFLYKPKRGR